MTDTKLTKERIEQIIANIDSDEARGATQSYVSYKVLRELCELALQGMGGEAVAWDIPGDRGMRVITRWKDVADRHAERGEKVIPLRAIVTTPGDKK
jgi:hypothetical protein